MDIKIKVLDLTHVHNFLGQTVNGVKILLFLELIIKKDSLVLGKGPIQGLDDTTITVEVKYPISFARAEGRFELSLHYN